MQQNANLVLYLQSQLVEKDKQICILQKRIEKTKSKLNSTMNERNSIVKEHQSEMNELKVLWKETILKHEEQQEIFSVSYEKFNQQFTSLQMDNDKLQTDLEHMENRYMEKHNENIQLETKLKLIERDFHFKRNDENSMQKKDVQKKYTTLKEKYEKLKVEFEREMGKKKLVEKELRTLLRDEKEYAQVVIQQLKFQIQQHELVLKQIHGNINQSMQPIVHPKHIVMKVAKPPFKKGKTLVKAVQGDTVDIESDCILKQ